MVKRQRHILLESSPDPSDVASRALQGDREAFSELYLILADPLSRYLAPLLGSKSATMDVIHDVFVRFWEQRSRIMIRESSRAFFYTMARNHALNQIKRNGRSVSTDFSEVQWRYHASIEHEQPEMKEKLDEWIQALSPRRAEAFMLSRYHDLSHAEIGRIMGLSERTVDTHIHHALRDLRERMSNFEAQS